MCLSDSLLKNVIFRFSPKFYVKTCQEVLAHIYFYHYPKVKLQSQNKLHFISSTKGICATWFAQESGQMDPNRKQVKRCHCNQRPNSQRTCIIAHQFSIITHVQNNLRWDDRNKDAENITKMEKTRRCSSFIMRLTSVFGCLADAGSIGVMHYTADDLDNPRPPYT